MAVTYTFSTQSGSIPLAQLDANFATPITIGNTSVQLGNTITTLNNITLANTTISGGNVTLTNVSITTANVTTANITNAVIGTANVTTANITSGVIATANITTGNVGTLTLTNALGTSSGGTGLSSFTSGGVVYASSTSALATGSALVFDGTNLGIGTSSPSEKLTVSGNASFSRFAVNANPINTTSTSQSFARFQSTGADFYIGTESSTAGGFFPSSTAYAAVLYNSSSTPMQFYTAGGLRATLDTSGNLTVPAMYSTTVTTPRNVFIDSTGKMGGISSTRASKTNISQLDTANWIYELNPVTFNYLKKDEEGEYLEEFEEEQQFGLIAEEVKLVKPELCIYTDDKVSGIHYDRMIAPLIKAIQELKASNDALTARIAQLEAK